jgi:ssDNA-binding Zn-finger/Zn-ribbon topoisomerase 1
MPEDRPTILKEKCPLCGGNLLLRKGKRGNFIGCSNYPKCHFIKNEKDTNEQALEKMKAREVKMKAFAKAKEDKLAKKTVENEMHGVEKTKTKFK